MKHTLYRFWCWLAYRFVMAWPLDWWPTMKMLPYAGEHAYGHASSAALKEGE